MAMICTRCGTIRERAVFAKSGSDCFEIVLWCCGILPGVVYHVWRKSTEAKVCPSCRSRQIIALSSPLGRKLQREIHGNRDGS